VVSEQIEIYNQMLEKVEAWINFKVKKGPACAGPFAS
jgi:hypothetical protein